jgi:hypothetical protein
MDVHVSATITGGLRRRNVVVLTSQEDGTREADDEILLRRASELACILVSQDQDLHAIASDWQRNGHPFSGLVFAPQGTSIGLCVEDLELIAQCTTDEEVFNRVIYLPLR